MKDIENAEATVLKASTTFTVTRQIDLDVKDKVDRRAFQEAARQIELPKVINDLGFVFITLICQATNEGKNEIWEHEGGAYITLTLPHRFVTQHTPDEVTQRFLADYKSFINQVVVIPGISGKS